MKSLIPWRSRNDQTPHFDKVREDLFSRFLGMPMRLDRSLFSGESWLPSVDVSEGRTDIIVKAEIPGVDRKDIDISLDGRLLTIRGEKKKLTEVKDGDHYLGDRYYGSFHRNFQLPADIVQEKVEATFKKGVLKISIPKAEESKIKKIAIKN